MDLNQLIFERLARTAGLPELLASFGGQPAIFNNEFPSDQQEGWEGKKQYPRISYRVAMQIDVQRASSGTLRTLIYCEKDMAMASQIEDMVKDAVRDVLIVPDSGGPFAAAWARTDPYVIEGTAILCRDVGFDIIEYPKQVTTDPDPTIALNTFIKDQFPDMFVVHVDPAEQFEIASTERPIIYVHLARNTTTGETNTVVWMQATMSIHVICPNAEMRLIYASSIANVIATMSELKMTDGSPMKIASVDLNNRADYLREGQVTVVATYGVLDYRHKPARLNRAVITSDHMGTESEDDETDASREKPTKGGWVT